MPKKEGWTEEEDMVLANYVERHGAGNWNMVERTTGIKRCGKSCRLRWFNHLRPNLKRGTFSPEEERIIVELHAKIGNRWAQIATQLPGRSDNDIKNFWNTRAKRLERARLPLYPRGIVPRYNQNRATPPASSSGTHLSNPSERSHPAGLVSYTPTETRLPELVTSNQIETRLPSPIETRLPTPNFTFEMPSQLSMGPFSYSGPVNHTLTSPNSEFRHNNPYTMNDNGGIFSLGSSSSSQPFSSNTHTPISFQYPFQPQSSSLSSNPNPLLGMPTTYEPVRFFANSGGPDLSESILGPRPTSFESFTGYNSMNMSSPYNLQNLLAPPFTDDGLLQDFIEVPETLVPADISSDKGASSSSFTINGEHIDDLYEEMFPLDDDLSALLESFPMEVPSPIGIEQFAKTNQTNINQH